MNTFGNTSKILPASILFLILFSFMFVLKAQGRFVTSDFKVYYGAASDLRLQNIESQNFGLGTNATGKVYDKPYGLPSGFYKYSPSALLVFLPLTYFSFSDAQIIFYVFTIFIFILAIHLSVRAIQSLGIKIKPDLAFVIITTLTLGLHYYREIFLLNVNALTLLLSLVSLLLLLQNSRTKLGSILYAVLLFFKPHFAALAIPLVAFRRFRFLGYILLSFILFLIVTCIPLGLRPFIELYSAWFKMIQSHNSLGQLINHQNTIYGWIYRILGFDSSSKQGLYLIIAFGAVIAYGGSRYIARFSSLSKSQGMLFSCLLVIAAIPNAMLTDTEHFLLSTPLIMLCANFLLTSKRAWRFIILILFIAYGGKIYDLIDPRVNAIWVDYGLIGMANLGVIATSCMIVLRERANN